MSGPNNAIVRGIAVFAAWTNAFAVCLDSTGEGYRYPTLDEEARDAYAVAIGTVTAKKASDDPRAGGDAGTRYHLKVQRTLRGEKRGSFDLFTPDTSARFPMEVGHKYLVFVMKDDDAFFIDSCGNSGELAERALTVRALTRGDTLMR